MKYGVFFIVFFVAANIFSQQQTISEINWNDVPRMESKAVPNQTTATLEVTANTPNANIYLNNDYLGKTPFLLRNLLPGIYKLRLTKDSYYEREFYITLNQGTENIVYIELWPITGFLSLEVEPKNAQIFIDGKSENAAFFELPEGSYKIEVKAFGYETRVLPVTITRRQSKAITVTLAPAEFSVSPLQLSVNRFNPQNPANLGTVKIDFSVTASGNGSIGIFNQNGGAVAQIPLFPFTTWQQTAYWDGKTAAGQFVPDGTYTIRLNAFAAEKAKEFTAVATVDVDESIFYPLQPLTFLGGSLGKNPSPLLFPQKTVYASITTSPHFELSEKGFLAAPVSFQFLYAPLPWLETTINAQMYLDGAMPLPISGGATIKAGGQTGAFLYAGFVRYGYASRTLSLLFSNAGFGAGAMLGAKIDWFTLSAHGEYVIGAGQGLFVPFEQLWNAGLAVHFQKNIFSATLWSKWISTKTLFSGIDASVLIPRSNILLNAEFAAAYPLNKPLVLSFTAGIAVLF